MKTPGFNWTAGQSNLKEDMETTEGVMTETELRLS